MEAHPRADEGMLSRARAGAVNTHALADCARRLGLGAHVRLGRGEERSNGADKPSILANAFEALLGALYADGGLDAVRTLVARELGPGLVAERQPAGDAKTRLQERLQAAGASVPSYRMVAESGPDHAKRFAVEVVAGERCLGRGEGSSKRDAEQAAAREALRALEQAPA